MPRNARFLFWDVMRQRGNAYREHIAKTAPHVLDYQVELVIDGRTLERPVNYVLVRVVPPPDVEVDPTRRPFVVVDPRAGHGPGIGGFKADSEIGVASQGRSSLLLRWVPTGSDAGSNHRGHRSRRGGVSREGDRPASARPTASPV